MRIFLLIMLSASLIACSQPVPVSLSSATGVLRSADVPLYGYTVYDAASDPNKLLGRPSSYIEKASWSHEEGGLAQSTIEVFKNNGDAERRRREVEQKLDAMPILGRQYIYLHKNLLVRISSDVTPQDAEKIEAAIKQL